MKNKEKNTNQFKFIVIAIMYFSNNITVTSVSIVYALLEFLKFIEGIFIIFAAKLFLWNNAEMGIGFLSKPYSCSAILYINIPDVLYIYTEFKKLLHYSYLELPFFCYMIQLY